MKTVPMKNILTTVVGLLAVAGIFYTGVLYSGTASPVPAPAIPVSAAPPVLSVQDTDAVRGSGPILLIEYSDYECPFCKRFHPTVQALTDSGEVTWVYRHLPLPIHRTAAEGAVIAECVRVSAGNDAFWTYTDAVFSAVDNPALPLYRALARAAGLSSAEIDACLAPGSAARAVVQKHLEEAQLFGINGTPGSFVIHTETGAFRRIPGALPLTGNPSVRGIIDELKQ